MFNKPDDFKVIDGVLWVNNRDMTCFDYVSTSPLRVHDISGLALCPHLTAVAVILESDTDLSPLRELRNLQRLHLYAGALDFEPLRGHPAIEDFHTTAVSVSAPWSSIIATFPKLKQLRVSHNWFRDDRVFRVQPFVGHPCMESLTIVGADIPDPENILKIPKLSFFNYIHDTEEGRCLCEQINNELEKRKASCA